MTSFQAYLCSIACKTTVYCQMNFISPCTQTRPAWDRITGWKARKLKKIPSVTGSYRWVNTRTDEIPLLTQREASKYTAVIHKVHSLSMCSYQIRSNIIPGNRDVAMLSLYRLRNTIYHDHITFRNQRQYDTWAFEPSRLKQNDIRCILTKVPF